MSKSKDCVCFSQVFFLMNCQILYVKNPGTNPLIPSVLCCLRVSEISLLEDNGYWVVWKVLQEVCEAVVNPDQICH